MKKIFFFTIAGSLLLSPMLPAEDAPKGGHTPEERLKRMTERLALTQDQQDKIKAIWDKNSDLKALWSKGRDSLSEEDKTKMRDLMKAQSEQVDAVLTPEQKAKMKEWRQKKADDKK